MDISLTSCCSYQAVDPESVLVLLTQKLIRAAVSDGLSEAKALLQVHSVPHLPQPGIMCHSSASRPLSPILLPACYRVGHRPDRLPQCVRCTAHGPVMAGSLHAALA